MDDILAWNNADNGITGPQEIEDEDNIIEIDDAEKENDENEPVVSTVKHIDAIQSFNTCLKWAEDNKIGYTETTVLKQLQEKAVSLSLLTRNKQSKIGDFFKINN